MKLFVAIAVLFCVCSPAEGQLEVTVQKSDFNRAVQEPFRFEQLIFRENLNEREGQPAYTYNHHVDSWVFYVFI